MRRSVTKNTLSFMALLKLSFHPAFHPSIIKQPIHPFDHGSILIVVSFHLIKHHKPKENENISTPSQYKCIRYSLNMKLPRAQSIFHHDGKCVLAWTLLVVRHHHPLFLFFFFFLQFQLLNNILRQWVWSMSEEEWCWLVVHCIFTSISVFLFVGYTALLIRHKSNIKYYILYRQLRENGLRIFNVSLGFVSIRW